MNATFSVSTDQAKKQTVESHILYALWLSNAGHAGGTARVEVRTTFVGEGATIEVTGRSEKGRKLGKIKDTISRNRFVGELDIPEKIDPDDVLYFEAKLPKHGLKMESNGIPVKPRILVKSMSWDKQEVRRGDALTLACEFESGVVDDEEAMVIIYEFSPEGHHDKVVSMPARVKGMKIEMQWEYRYADTTRQIATDAERSAHGKKYVPPEYFFVVVVDEERIGSGQESGMVAFRDWVDYTVRDSRGTPIADKSCTITLADGSTRDGAIDANGRIRIEDVPPGPVAISVEGLGRIVVRAGDAVPAAN